MSKAATSGILSAVVVVAWTGVYFSQHPQIYPNSTSLESENDYDDYYDVLFYPLKNSSDASAERREHIKGVISLLLICCFFYFYFLLLEIIKCFHFQMMKHAWDNYVKYAWGKNELRSITKRAHSASIFGSMPVGATILDGLDTLYIMGMQEEFKKGREWIANELNIDTLVSFY